MSSHISNRDFISVTVFIFGFLASFATAQLLKAQYLDPLPGPNRCKLPYYEGEDHIYLFDGCHTVEGNKILRLTISTGALEFVANLTGQAAMINIIGDGFGNMYHFTTQEVYKFDPVTKISTFLVRLPAYIIEGVALNDHDGDGNSIYVTDGDRQLYWLDVVTGESAVVTTFPQEIYDAAASRVGNKVYIFDSGQSVLNRKSLELDLETFRVMQVGPPTLPIFHTRPSSAYDGNKFIYILGGYRPSYGTDPVYTTGIFQFDTVTFENRYIPVEHLPLGDANFFMSAPATVFVPRLNRIYCFGGYVWIDWGIPPLDTVFFIDLTPLDA